MHQTDGEKPQLLRKMNLFDSILLVIGGIIGSGIFMTTGFIAESLTSPGLIVLVWLVGGFIALCGALAFAELGAMFPRAGGQYVYLREAYGSLAGFLYGWGFFWVIGCGALAALAVGFADYLGYFFPALSTKAIIFRFSILNLNYSLSSGQIVAVIAILLLTAVNYFGVKHGIFVQNLLTVLKIVAVAVIVIFGFALGKKAGTIHINQFFPAGVGFSLKLFGLALIPVFWTYDGWYSINCTAEEVKKPERNIPLGLIIGMLSVAIIYCLVNVVYVMALPVERMKGVARIGELASSQLFGPTATSFISATIMISIFGCLAAATLYHPRVFFAMAEDGIFFKRMAHVHPRYRVPANALIGQAIWTCLLCLSGTFQGLLEFVVFALVIFYAATGYAVVALRSKKPDGYRPYKAWGYPYLPLFLLQLTSLSS